jgi:hypothetical protein
MSADVKKLGYEGAVQIVSGGSSVQLLASSASFSVDSNTPTMVGIDMPPPTDASGAEVRSRFIYAVGTINSSGSLSFDCTDSFMPVLFNICSQRGVRFDVRIAGGEGGVAMDDCYMTSVSLSGSSGGLVSGSMSFVSKNDWEDGAGFTPTHNDPISGTYEEPMAYWYTGSGSSADVKEWSLSISQSATPVFGNVPGVNPLYVRIGAMEASLTVLTYFEIKKLEQIVIKTNTAKIVSGVEDIRDFNFSTSELSTFSHTFMSVRPASGGSVGDVITFS